MVINYNSHNKEILKIVKDINLDDKNNIMNKQMERRINNINQVKKDLKKNKNIEIYFRKRKRII